jgi:hypothetical protein
MIIPGSARHHVPWETTAPSNAIIKGWEIKSDTASEKKSYILH